MPTDVPYTPSEEDNMYSLVYCDLLLDDITNHVSESFQQFKTRKEYKNLDSTRYPVVFTITQQGILDILPSSGKVLPHWELVERGLIPDAATTDKIMKQPGELLFYALFWSVNYKFNLFGEFRIYQGRKTYRWMSFNRLEEQWWN